MKKILIIQTAFIGDVVLATALIEKLHIYHKEAHIDFLVRKGNESLLENNPYLHKVLTWDKKEHKIKNLFSLLTQVRKARYDIVINLQRFLSTGMLTGFSGAKITIGFDKNPLSFLYSKKVKHVFDVHHPRHEVQRNNDLIKDFTDDTMSLPALYPSPEDEQKISHYTGMPYVTMTPSSVWFTKKYPAEKWISLIDRFDPAFKIYLLGGKENMSEAELIIQKTINKNIEAVAGKLSFLQSAAMMRTAVMNYTNDSAPMHFASAVNAPVTAIFCSTVPAFGYTPLSSKSYIVETQLHLKCRPCGIHGYKACPLEHFECAHSITTNQLLETLCK